MATAVGAIGIGSSILGGIFGASGAKQQAAAQAAQYQFQAGQALRNARIARENRDYAWHVGGYENVQQGLKSRYVLGKIIATQGASGIDVNKGSAKDVQISHDYISDMDRVAIYNNAARRAYAYETEALGLESQAQMYSMAASNAQAAGKTNILGSLIGTASSVSSKWLQGSQMGMW